MPETLLSRFRRFGRFVLPVLAFCAASTIAAEFDWRSHADESLLVLLNKHPYAEMIVDRIDEFEQLTGIRVAYLMVPEDLYFPRVEASFSAEAGRPDVFMTGPYQVWEYAPEGHMVELDAYITDSFKTSAAYFYHDFYPGISGAFRWSGKAGQKTGDGALWGVPIGFELNCLIYNHEVLAAQRLHPPRSIEEMTEVGAGLRAFGDDDVYGLAVRGANDWNTLHSGYMTAFVNYGGRDMDVEGGHLTSKVNSPEAVAMTDLWLGMIAKAGPPDWRGYDWYRCGEDIGSRKAAMMFDADIIGYFKNISGASQQSGRLAAAPPLAPSGIDPGHIRSNLWVWGLAMNADSENKDAAWYFIQYFTAREFQMYSVLEGKSINPPRRSVFESAAFQEKIASMEGFSRTFAGLIDNSAIFFTPTPYFFEIARRWVATLHDIADGKYASTQEGMDALKGWMDERLKDVLVE